MRKSFNWVVGFLGVGAGLIISAIALFAFPLSVVAQMRMFGLSWWQALLGSSIILLIPLLGQIAFLVSAIVGTYYLVAAKFHISAAINPPIQTVDITKVSPEKFMAWKARFLKPNFREQCQQELVRKMGVDGKLPTIAASYCDCVTRIIIEEIRQEDLTSAGQIRFNAAPPRYTDRIKSECSRKL